MKHERKAILYAAAAAFLLGCSSGGDASATDLGDGGGPDATVDAGSGDSSLSGDVVLVNDASGVDAPSPGDGSTGSDAPSVPDAGSDGSPLSSDAGADAPGPACGGSVCPSGFTCSAANYCVSPDGVPAFGHVYVIMMENTSLSTLQASATAPYINGLLAQYSYATAYNSVAHPSLPNYIALTSGATQGIGCDCEPTGTSACIPVICLVVTGCNCGQKVTNLGDVLDGVSVPWREYGEEMGTPCNTTSQSEYATKHIPFLYYDDIQNGPNGRCQDKVRDYADFSADLAAGTYRFSFISPNLCGDMHDTCADAGTDSINQGDNWLKANVAPILATPGFGANGNDALFIIWDEQDNSTGNAPVPIIFVSPLVKPGSMTATAYDHYSMLATIESGFGVPKASWLGSSATAKTISDIWK